MKSYSRTKRLYFTTTETKLYLANSVTLTPFNAKIRMKTIAHFHEEVAAKGATRGEQCLQRFPIVVAYLVWFSVKLESMYFDIRFL